MRRVTYLTPTAKNPANGLSTMTDITNHIKHNAAAQLLIVGSGEWTQAALAACPAELTPAIARLPSDVDLSAVKILLGAPGELINFIPLCPKLQWVQSTWAGVDAIAHLASERLAITTLKGVFGQAMSEYVVGWLVAIERQIITRANVTAWLDTADGTVAGKTVGIMGTGSIGTAIAQSCKAMHMRCKGLNSDGRLQPDFETCFSTPDRLTFARGLDYLVSVLPDTSATQQLVDQELLNQLAPGAIFINVGRGNVVDENALLAALRSGQLRSAVLDVFNTEPLPSDHAFWRTENLYITAHTAAPTPTHAILTIFTENLNRFLNNAPLLHRVCQHKGY